MKSWGVIILLCACACGKKYSNLDTRVREKSIGIVGAYGYDEAYRIASDTLSSWVYEGLYQTKYGLFNFMLDSLVCFNESGDRLIGAVLHFYTGSSKSCGEGISYFFGKKEKGTWCFWTKDYFLVQRHSFEGHQHTVPLSYAQLHSRALRYIYSDYLNADNDLDPSWFQHHFDGPQWGSVTRNRELRYFDGTIINRLVSPTISIIQTI